MPNLSLERLALVLALAGCSKATPAADTTSTVRSDPSATVTATAAAITGGAASPKPGGAASAIEMKKKDMGPTGQASCGAGSCSSEIKKK
jgi:hypothetical protein